MGLQMISQGKLIIYKLSVINLLDTRIQSFALQDNCAARVQAHAEDVAKGAWAPAPLPLMPKVCVCQGNHIFNVMRAGEYDNFSEYSVSVCSVVRYETIPFLSFTVKLINIIFSKALQVCFSSHGSQLCPTHHIVLLQHWARCSTAALFKLVFQLVYSQTQACVLHGLCKISRYDETMSVTRAE